MSGLGTAVIGLAIHKTLGFRVSHEDEVAGVDRSEHAETAYAFAELAFSRFNPFGHHVQAHHHAHDAAGHAAAAAPAAVLRRRLLRRTDSRSAPRQTASCNAAAGTKPGRTA